MAYEMFKRTGARVEEPTLSIVPDGRIAINAAAVRILLEAEIKSVLLLWDRVDRKLALKAAGRGDKNAFAVSFSDRHSGIIRAKSFFNHIGWNAGQREMLPATWREKEKMFEITLPFEYVGSEKVGTPKRKATGI
jgi:hypothetical protein